MGLNLVIMGPPGAGKGTQAVQLGNELGVAHLSTGDLLRREVAAASPIGVKTRSYMESGVLVPDKVMSELVAGHVLRAAGAGTTTLGAPQTPGTLGAPQTPGTLGAPRTPGTLGAPQSPGFILDGYPRTVEQAQDMQSLLAKHGLSLSGVVNIQLPDAEIIERLVNRQTCPKCQRSYNRKANQPRVPGTCNECGTGLITRKDDTEEVIRHRIRVYWEQTAPVVEYYRSRGLLRNVDGSQPINRIVSSLKDILTNFNTPRSALA